MLVDRIADEDILVAGAGEQLDGQDIGIAVDDAAGQVRAHFRHVARALAHLRQEDAQHHGIAGEPEEDRQRQPPIGRGEKPDSAGAIDQDVPDRVDHRDDALAQIGPGLHDPGGNPAGEIVLEKSPALADHMPMVLPAHQVCQPGDQRLVADQMLHQMRERPQHQEQHRHQQQLRHRLLPDRLLLLLGNQRHDPADADRDRGVEQRHRQTGHEQRNQQPRDLAHVMPVEAPQRMGGAEQRRRAVGLLCGRFDQAFEKAEHGANSSTRA